MFENDSSDDSGLQGEVRTQEGLYLQVYDQVGFFNVQEFFLSYYFQ